MSDELTTTNGKAEFAYLDSISPWHGKGTAVTFGLTLDEMIAEAGVDFTVSKQGLMTNPGLVEVPGTYALVRDDTQALLGTTGERYTVFPHQEGLARINAVLNGEPLSTLGSLYGGGEVFGCWDLTTLTVGPEVINRYLVARFGHNGKAGVDVFNTDVCAVCHNTVEAGFASAGRRWSARHTDSIGERFDSIAAELDDLFNGKSAAQMIAEVERLLNSPITDDKVGAVLDEVFPVRDGKAVSADAWSVRGIYEQHPTIRNRNGEDVHGTEWGLYQSVSFFDLWAKDVRGDRLERQIFAALDDDPTPNARKALAVMAR